MADEIRDIVLSDDGELIFAQDAGEEIPEGMRVTVPEPELRRRTVYGFRRDYPDSDSPFATHTVPFATLERQRKLRNRLLYIVGAIAAFCVSYIITAAALIISAS